MHIHVDLVEVNAIFGNSSFFWHFIRLETRLISMRRASVPVMYAKALIRGSDDVKKQVKWKTMWNGGSTLVKYTNIHQK